MKENMTCVCHDNKPWLKMPSSVVDILIEMTVDEKSTSKVREQVLLKDVSRLARKVCQKNVT